MKEINKVLQRDKMDKSLLIDIQLSFFFCSVLLGRKGTSVATKTNKQTHKHTHIHTHTRTHAHKKQNQVSPQEGRMELIANNCRCKL